MAFEGLSSKLQNIFRKLGGKGKLTEKEVKEAMREIKLALLEADVNFSVVKSFINNILRRRYSPIFLTLRKYKADTTRKNKNEAQNNIFETHRKPSITYRYQNPTKHGTQHE